MQQGLPAGLGFDQDAIGPACAPDAVLDAGAAVLCAPVLDRPVAQVRVRQMLIPRINEHGVALVVVREDRPDRAGRGVARGLLGEGAVVGLQDVFELRQRLVRRPELEVVRLQDAAAGRGRILLQLASRAVLAEQLLEGGDLFLAEALRADQLADLLAWIVLAEDGPPSRAVPLSRDADVFPPADVFEDVAADVLLMQALHDGDHGVGLRVVQSG